MASETLAQVPSWKNLTPGCFWTAQNQWGRTQLIIIAAGISDHNYQRRFIQSLIASFNLFTFAAEQRQPAAVESD